MNYAIQSNKKICEEKNKIIKKVVPHKDPNNIKGLSQDEKNKIIMLLMKKYSIGYELAEQLLYAKNGKYREKLLELSGKMNENIYSSIVELDYFARLFGNYRYNKVINEELFCDNYNIIEVKPIIRLTRMHLKVVNKVLLKCITDKNRKVTFKAYLQYPIIKDSSYFKLKKEIIQCAKKILGNKNITYTNKTHLVLKPTFILNIKMKI